jgi:hypothetical protein
VHLPLHKVWPAGQQEQVAGLKTWPWAQLVIHAPPHEVVPSGQVQPPCTQMAPLVHARLQAPQLALSVDVFTHVLPQTVVPVGQVQVPPWHTAPPVQLVLQSPQAALSLSRLRHVPQQFVVPVGHSQVQELELNCCPPLHLVDAHWPLQTTCPDGQVAHLLVLGVVPAQ